MVVWWVRVRRPRPKKTSSLVPRLLKESLPNILLSHQDKTYDDPPPCPVCRSEKRTRRDRRRRLYATVITDNGYQDIWVWVKRYRCRACGKVYASQSPFYPNCLYGNLVTETCLYLASTNPFCRVEAILQQYGLQIDRDTVRNYVRRFGARAAQVAGIRIDTASVAINLVRLLFDAVDVEELRQRMPWEVFQDVADETYPPVKGGKRRMREENLDRSLRREAARRYPESHTLAACYEAQHGFFLSIMVTSAAFNTMLAEALCRPAKGCVGSVRDGSSCYGEEHIHCVNHKARRLIARDPEYRRLKKKAESRDQIHDYCIRYYGNVREKEAAKAAQTYPELVQKGVFVGALSTNSMEGGNWRIKYGLKVPYKYPTSLEARTLLLAISDSVKTYKEGKPCQTFAQIHGSFTYADVMGRPQSTQIQTGTTPSSNQKNHTKTYLAWLTQAIDRAQNRHSAKEVTTTPT